MKKYLIIPDCHFPFVDLAAWDLLLKIGRTFKPYGIITMGDFIDCYSVSQFAKMRRMSIEEEIEAAKKGLKDLESLGAKKHHFIKGNHEVRLDRYLKEKCAEVFGLFPSLRTLLAAEKWSWTEYHDILKIGRAHFTHDVGGSGALAHIKACTDVGGNVAIGHTHFAGIQYKGTLRGSAYFGSALGCLADRDKVDYAHKARVAHWVHACGLGYLYPDGDFHLTLTPFVRGRATVEGKEVRV